METTLSEWSGLVASGSLQRTRHLLWSVAAAQARIALLRPTLSLSRATRLTAKGTGESAVENSLPEDFLKIGTFWL